MLDIVLITKDEAESLVEWIECDFIQSIQNNTEIDNMQYVANICSIWGKCKEMLKGSEE